jgi:hypothetical protein
MLKIMHFTQANGGLGDFSKRFGLAGNGNVQGVGVLLERDRDGFRGGDAGAAMVAEAMDFVDG